MIDRKSLEEMFQWQAVTGRSVATLYFVAELEEPTQEASGDQPPTAKARLSPQQFLERRNRLAAKAHSMVGSLEPLERVAGQAILDVLIDRDDLEAALAAGIA